VAQIPLLYAFAMGVDAVAALLIGKIYDRVGLKILVFIPLVTLPLPLLAFSQQYGLAIITAVLWGLVMAMHETIMRAGLADLVPSKQRAFAYGLFNTIYGAGWLLSGAALGSLFSLPHVWLVGYVVVMEACALLIWPFLARSAASRV